MYDEAGFSGGGQDHQGPDEPFHQGQLRVLQYGEHIRLPVSQVAMGK